MKKYINVDKLITEIEKEVTKWKDKTANAYSVEAEARWSEANRILVLCNSLIEHPNNMIQWTGNNLKEVIYFTGKSPRFEEWFKSWEEYENYVHSHNNILKLFCEDGSHYEVPIGAWIVKTPDGYNVPSVAKYIQQKQPKSICPRCVYRNKTDDICEYPYGGRDCLINENGVYKCNGFEEVEQQEQPHKSFCEENCKGYRDTGGKCFFGFDCSVKKAHEQEVDLEKALDEYYKIADFSPSDAIEYDTHKDIARHFYELGKNTRKEE